MVLSFSGLHVFGTQHLALFVLSGFLLNLTPGQDTFYIVGRSLAQGRRAGVLSVLGITSGCVVHTVAAAFGLSAILATSAQAFLVVKLTGRRVSRLPRRHGCCSTDRRRRESPNCRSSARGRSIAPAF